MATSRQPIEQRCGDRNLLAWIRLACLLLVAALATPFFLGRVYVADDLGEYHLPLRAFYSQQLSCGEAFDWLPSLYNGFYLTGEGQLGTYHPLHWLLYRWLPLGAAFDLELLLSYPFMLVGMALWLNRLLGNRAAAWFGGLVFTFSGFNLLHFVHPNAVAVVAHIPWLLWAIDLVLRSPTPRTAARAELAFGALTASQLLLGYPQYVWFSLLVEAAYLGWRTIRGDTAGFPRRLLLAGFCGILMGAVQWLPTLDALAGSVRKSADLDFANSGSLDPLNLVQLIAPYLFQTRVVGQNTHELGLYIGATACLLCCWLAFNRRRLGRLLPLASFALFLGIVSLLLAFGQYGFFYQLEHYVPLVNRFRFPCRAIVLFHLAVAIGAALGFMLLVRSESRRAGDSWRTHPVWFVAAGSIIMAAAGPWLWPRYVASFAWICVGPALFVAAALLITLAARGYRLALVGLVILAALDQGFYGASYAVYAPDRTAALREFVATTPVPPAAGGVRLALDAPCADSNLQAGNRVLLAGASRVDGYAGLVPDRRLDYRQTDALRLAAARWQQTCAADGREQGDHWAPIEKSLPRVRFVTKTVPEQSLSATAPLARLVNEDAAAVAEPLNLPAGKPGSVSVAVDRPGQLTLSTNSETRQLLVLADSFHSGWQVAIDGVPSPVLRVNGDFLGCVVPTGDHQLVWKFRPSSLRYGLVVSACGLGLMLCSFAFHGRVRRGAWASGARGALPRHPAVPIRS